MSTYELFGRLRATPQSPLSDLLKAFEATAQAQLKTVHACIDATERLTGQKPGTVDQRAVEEMVIYSTALKCVMNEVQEAKARVDTCIDLQRTHLRVQSLGAKSLGKLRRMSENVNRFCEDDEAKITHYEKLCGEIDRASMHDGESSADDSSASSTDDDAKHTRDDDSSADDDDSSSSSSSGATMPCRPSGALVAAVQSAVAGSAKFDSFDWRWALGKK